MGAARERFQKQAAEALAQWRLNCIPPRAGDTETIALKECLADLIRMRIELAYTPVFKTLMRIEAQFDILGKSGRDRWAPPAKRPVMRPMPRNQLPIFLRDEARRRTA